VLTVLKFARPDACFRICQAASARKGDEQGAVLERKREPRVAADELGGLLRADSAQASRLVPPPESDDVRMRTSPFLNIEQDLAVRAGVVRIETTLCSERASIC
jgi:hypothetical protein